MRPLARYIADCGLTADQLAGATNLNQKLVKAIVAGNYTPSPDQRQRIAAALGVPIDEISWDHAVPVEHLRGNGPQAGRPT